MKSARRLILFPVFLLLAACDDGSGPVREGVPESSLEFVRFPPDLLPLVTPEGSFWAVRGDDRQLVLRYQPEFPGEEGEEFLEFRVPGDALLRAPDGRLYQDGDSVLIQVAVDDGGRFIFDFQPSGLRFDPDHPARLKVTYRRTEGDLDGDGDEDEEDARLEDELDLWMQDIIGGPWFLIGGVKLEDLDELEAEIVGFTGFAIAG